MQIKFITIIISSWEERREITNKRKWAMRAIRERWWRGFEFDCTQTLSINEVSGENMRCWWWERKLRGWRSRAKLNGWKSDCFGLFNILIWCTNALIFLLHHSQKCFMIAQNSLPFFFSCTFSPARANLCQPFMCLVLNFIDFSHRWSEHARKRRAAVCSSTRNRSHVRRCDKFPISDRLIVQVVTGNRRK